MNALFAKRALLPDGWADDVVLEWSPAGTLTRITPGAARFAGVERVGLVVPGMVNLHSHAFQRALAGRTEYAGDGPDSFWTWRELMYRFAQALRPEHAEAIAARLYSDCLRHGYTSICEFHYVQRDEAGALYPRPAELAERVVAAARATGIGLTMLPVLYSWSGFGERPLGPEQQRFRTDVDDVLRIVEALEPERAAQLEVGIAPHSLRAASLAQIRQLVESVRDRPVHLHIAEQTAEVEGCVAMLKRRPVQALFDAVPVDARFCLVHATHIEPDEVRAIAASGAVVGLCPTTEANLGDGLFPLSSYLEANGRIGIGSDSHVSRSPIEELRWLEYGQRLAQRRRNIATSATTRQVGDFLWQAAVSGGAQASGRPVGALATGKRADLLVLASQLEAGSPVDVMGRLVFGGDDELVRHVLVGGRWCIRDGIHADEAAIAARYRRTLAELG